MRERPVEAPEVSKSKLLERDEPPPFEIIRERSTSPLVLVCDHASNRIPRQLGSLGLGRKEHLERHIAWDVGAANVARRLSDALDATLILSGYSRLVVDLNRPLHVADAIATKSEDTTIPGNIGLTPRERRLREETLYWPYHDAIHTIVSKRAEIGPPPMVVSVHSFVPVYLGERRPWHIGVLYRTDRRLADLVLNELGRERGLHVGANEPYDINLEEDYTIPVHCERRGTPYVLLELRHDLVSTDEGASAWSQRLASILCKSVGHPDLARYARAADDVAESRYRL